MVAGAEVVYRSVAMALAICLILEPAPLFASTGVRLLLTGDFHAGEVDALTGERWLGLFRTDTGFELAGTVVKVETVEDAILDEPGQKTGKKVSVDRGDEPVFMLSGVEGLKEGPVATSFSGEGWLKRGRTVEMGMAGKKYTLTASGEGEDDLRLENYRLVLARGGLTQEIAVLEFCCNDNMPSLIWAGDVDGDGALDLFLDLTSHYNMTKPTLFLSSLAGEGELVGRAAGLVTYGC